MVGTVTRPQREGDKEINKLAPGLSVFATYAESFVPGTQILLVRNELTTPAQPTEGRGVDVGVKADLFGGRLTGTLALFEVRNRSIVNAIAELDPATGSQVFTLVQSGTQRSRGVEVDLTLTPVDDWQVYLSYSYNDARIVEFSANDQAVLAGGPSMPGYKDVFLFHNARLQMSAPHLANLWTRYDLTRSFLKGLYVAGGFNLVVDQTLLPDSDQRQSYVLLNATVGYSHEWVPGFALSIELWGKNLANEHYRPSQSSRSRPRELGVQVRGKY